MSPSYLVGCHDCALHRTVEDLNTALDWFDRHKELEGDDHTVEVWSKQYLEEKGDEAPPFAPSLSDGGNAPSPQPTDRKNVETDSVETDD